ncbi:hypothetical protein ABT373_27160 [Streptomyces sp. NPDC000070]|uniref:hypothetical protein n=1 Tax=Streptomyces sp. NPDC000070 TaxID=3154240 RepID=UPI00331D802E
MLVLSGDFDASGMDIRRSFVEMTRIGSAAPPPGATRAPCPGCGSPTPGCGDDSDSFVRTNDVPHRTGAVRAAGRTLTRFGRPPIAARA